ncbi:hypothetical protein Rsub_12706 [Raphidocelis subcapitata]|uniref:Serine aminopeptidase S33 domain-containing protein n=1 Tax=Raphidocelis subcapitata TaxID=307507 RepID=A0A2V0PQ82_9CHLO|nr:hypothetical protein Rsub_12706 [Raphidocelis subcapitata]|eukprot:GBG00221.1 hypothetical protein Rsub_12706 [Raphidocelis subcapitata]
MESPFRCSSKAGRPAAAVSIVCDATGDAAGLRPAPPLVQPLKPAAPAALPFKLASPRGHDLAAHLLMPACGAPPRGLVVFAHGLNEHSCRKLRALQAVADAARVAVAAADASGHGLSGPAVPAMRGVVRDYRHLVDDAAALVAALRSPPPGSGVPPFLGGLPLVLGGYSMGGATALALALRAASGCDPALPRPAGLFLVAPALALSEQRSYTLAERLKLACGGVINAVAPLARLVEPLPVRALHSCPCFAEEYEADALVLRGPIAVCTLHSIVAAGRALSTGQAAGALSSLPLLVCSPGDRLVDYGAVAALVKAARAAGNTNAALVTLPGDAHDVLSGPEGPAVAGRIAGFVASVL